MFWDDAEQDEFADVADTDELCRRLLGPAGAGFGRSSYQPVIDLLRRVREGGELGTRVAALLLCTSPRWDRVTGRLIASLEASGVFAEHELDELADTLTADALVFEFPAAWVSSEWLGKDVTPPGSLRSYRIDEHTPMTVTRHIAPPLRRWSARRTLTADPGRHANLLELAERLDQHGRGALLLGLLDAGSHLDHDNKRRLMHTGLATGMARVRCAALDLTADLDGADAALQRARRDRDAKVRAWRPCEPRLDDTPTLP